MKTNDADISEAAEGEFAPGMLKQAAERELAAGVLKQATQDLRRFHVATSKVERELYIDAYRWLTVDDCSSPFSFLNVCRLLNHRPDELREYLLGDLALGIFGQWARRGTRAFRRLSNSFTLRFAPEYDPSTATAAGLVQTWH